MMRFLTLLVVALAACSAKTGDAPIGTDGAAEASVDLGPPPLCTPGAQLACACPGGASSVQVCGTNGTLGPCACPDAGSLVDVGFDVGIDVPDVFMPLDVPDVVDVPADRPVDRPAVDVGCAPLPDTCPRGSYCSGAGAACAAGCRNDGDCNDGRHCHVASHDCLTCLSDDHCPAGMVCNASACVAGCNAGRSCLGGLSCCSGACVDTRSATSNCGACDRRCSVSNAMSACVAGTCSIGACSAGFADCDGMGSNGCEVSTGLDVMNCGGCGAACAARLNATATCAAGICALACRVGYANCDDDTVNGCETDINTNAANCGHCGTGCAGRQTCQGGRCTYPCVAPYASCDGDTINGCETDTATAPLYCGDCTTHCGAPSTAIATCIAGRCGSMPCSPGSANCDGNPANGCEVNTTTSSMNCGACENACPAGQSCHSGSCS